MHSRMKDIFDIVDRGVKAQAKDDLTGVFDAMCDLKVLALQMHEKLVIAEFKQGE